MLYQLIEIYSYFLHTDSTYVTLPRL